MTQPSPANDDARAAANQSTAAAVPAASPEPEPATRIPLSKDLRDTALVLLIALPVVVWFVAGGLRDMAAERSDRHYNEVAHEFSAADWQLLLEQCERWHATLWPLKEGETLTDAQRRPGPDQELVSRLGFPEVSLVEDVRIRFYLGNRAMKFVAAMPELNRPAIMRYRPLPSPGPELADIGRELPWDTIHIDHRFLAGLEAGAADDSE